MKKLLMYSGIVSAVALFGSAANATKPSCEDMGYKNTVEDCTGYYMLHCPWDHSKVYCDCPYKYEERVSAGDPASGHCIKYGKVYYKDVCPGQEKETCDKDSNNNPMYLSGSSCTATSGQEYVYCVNSKPCSVGDVLFSNGKCYYLLTPSNTNKAIGIVFDSENKLAVALDEAHTNAEAGVVEEFNSFPAILRNFGNCNPGGWQGYNYNSLMHMAGLYGYPYNRMNMLGVSFVRHCENPANITNFEQFAASMYGGDYRTKGFNHSGYSWSSSNYGGGYQANYKLLSSVLGNDYNAASVLNNNNAKKFPAAYYCATYSTSGTSAGEWTLPAPGDWGIIRQNINTINYKLRMLRRISSNISALDSGHRINLLARDYSNSGVIHNSWLTAHGWIGALKPQYWTSYIHHTHYPYWMLGYNNNYQYWLNGPIIYDMASNSITPGSALEVGVRARCIIKYDEAFSN